MLRINTRERAREKAIAAALLELAAIHGVQGNQEALDRIACRHEKMAVAHEAVAGLIRETIGALAAREDRT